MKNFNTSVGVKQRGTTGIQILSIFLLLAILLGMVWGLDALSDRIEKDNHPLKYGETIEKYSAQYGIPKYLMFAIIKTESDFNCMAISPKGARGLMQMMPDTFVWLTGKGHLNDPLLTSDSLFIPEISIKYGAYYLSYLYKKFGNWDTVLAAYNGGEGNVSSWLTDAEYSDGNGNLKYIPFKETRKYVDKVNEHKNIYEKLYSESEGTKNEQK